MPQKCFETSVDPTYIASSGEMGGVENDCVDAERSRYPHSIVWTPIPLLTWLIPVIGHMGIATSSGVIRDFAGPYMVGEDNMAFGEPSKYWQVNLVRESISPDQWDRAVVESCEEYKHRVHILCWDNCHSHVAYALNRMRFRGRANWSAFGAWLYLTMNSQFVSSGRFLKTYVPFFILCTIIAVVAITSALL